MSASVAVIVTSGESESLYCTDWLPPPSELVTTGNAWIVKSLWFTSKKMLPTASTLIRAFDGADVWQRHCFGAIVRGACREHVRVGVAAVRRKRNLDVGRERWLVGVVDVPGDRLVEPAM